MSSRAPVQRAPTSNRLAILLTFSRPALSFLLQLTSTARIFGLSSMAFAFYLLLSYAYCKDVPPTLSKCSSKTTSSVVSYEAIFYCCVFFFASFAAISSCMLMGPGLAAGLAFPAAGEEEEEEEAGAPPSACLPGTSGALRSLINDLSTFFSLPKPAPLMSPSNAAVLGAPPPPPPPTAEGGGGGGGGPPPLDGGGGGGFGALEGGGGGGRRVVVAY